MDKRDYIDHLKQKGYTVLDENRVSLGTLVFDIQENKAAAGTQTSFCLKLSVESDMNLVPSPWS